MKRPLTALLAALLASAPVAHAADEKSLTKAETEALIKKVIHDNPELIFQTLLDYQSRTHLEEISKRAVNVSKQQDKLNYDPRSPWAGNPKGDVTVVEFFDYHCGYCKSFVPELGKLIDQDKNVRVVFKEYPILSEDSTYAAKASLAVFQIDPAKYMDYHIQLMSQRGNFNEEILTSLAQRVGIDPETFKKKLADPEIEKDLANNRELAGDLGISSTPTIVVGTDITPGAISYEGLKKRVEDVRNGQKQLKTGDTKKGK